MATGARYFDPDRAAELTGDTAALLNRRQHVLGSAYRLFYDEPLHLVRGDGVHVYDADGVEYLDCYNNVPVIGHAHPAVTAAVAAQLGRLNTHTRYLHEGIVDYSEALLATLPAELGRVMLSCSGSEAGDLALRLAKARTGNTGVIVTRSAYHGVTTETAAVSPSLGGLASLPSWVRVVAAPDALRVDHAAAGYPSLGAWFAAEVAAAADDLTERGHGVAALLLDSIFASDGVLPGPAGLLAPAVEVVHRAGGLYVADEVQAGFARTGAQLWGFTRHGVVPDIVTMGKPMGNGMPIAATVLRPEISDDLGRQVRYFSTFGGNPVCVAAAQTVLDVITADDLPQHSADVGRYLLRALRELALPAIGEVRGAGLFLGVELVRPDGSPDAATARAAVNELRRRRVLTGTTGPSDNVLKLRPPLPFSTADADRLVTELVATLTALTS
ncbi:MAG TPA: aminotransferase class III-fold pyridoxal phosphate-dependent enzyme [Candidatus Nanopelagicales bacterium]|nr:aminotransferase class III-fold pyridoxal phosphate-dependent enzyme [Candidatus Nanopelagicales bacterium]